MNVYIYVTLPSPFLHRRSTNPLYDENYFPTKRLVFCTLCNSLYGVKRDIRPGVSPLGSGEPALQRASLRGGGDASPRPSLREERLGLFLSMAGQRGRKKGRREDGDPARGERRLTGQQERLTGQQRERVTRQRERGQRGVWPEATDFTPTFTASIWWHYRFSP